MLLHWYNDSTICFNTEYISVSASQGGIVLGGIASAMLLQQDRK